MRLQALMEAQQRAEIGSRIRDLRGASPETNRSIAEYVGVGERAVANWIAGETGITYKNAKKVAELFEVDVRWLWDGKEREATPDVLSALDSAPHREQLDRMEKQLRALDKKMVELSTAVADLALESRAQTAQAPKQRTAKRQSGK